jgi:hypothetical protein
LGLGEVIVLPFDDKLSLGEYLVVGFTEELNHEVTESGCEDEGEDHAGRAS